MSDETPRDDEDAVTTPVVTPMPAIKDSDVDDWSHHSSENPSAQPSRFPSSSVMVAVVEGESGHDSGNGNEEDGNNEDERGNREEDGNEGMATDTTTATEGNGVMQEVLVEGGSDHAVEDQDCAGIGGGDDGTGEAEVIAMDSRQQTPATASLRTLVTGLSLKDDDDIAPILGSGLDEDAQELQGQGLGGEGLMMDENTAKGPGLGSGLGPGLGQVSATSMTGSIDDESHVPLDHPTDATMNHQTSPNGLIDDSFQPTTTSLIRSKSTGHHVKTIRSTLNLKQMNLGNGVSYRMTCFNALDDSLSDTPVLPLALLLPIPKRLPCTLNLYPVPFLSTLPLYPACRYNNECRSFDLTRWFGSLQDTNRSCSCLSNQQIEQYYHAQMVHSSTKGQREICSWSW